MILTESEVDQRLSSPDNLVNKIEIRPMRAEKSESARVPELVKILLGNLAIDNGSEAVSDAFNVSQGSVSRYSRGMVGDKVVEELKPVLEKHEGSIEEKKSSAHSLALDGLLDSLTLLKPALTRHASDMKPGTIARIATDMSKISKNLEKEEVSVTNNTQVILYQPNQRKESQYETIEA